MFQFPVVYDAMTVAQNLAFPLKNRGVPTAEIAARGVHPPTTPWPSWTSRPGLTGARATSPPTSSRRFRLGRGLVRTDVNAVLFDEPLTVIDPQMKWALRAQLKDIHRQFGHTMIYVTHDQTEALTFADQVVVMYEGEIVQIGTPAELFDHPRHTFVGYFIGSSPGMNLDRRGGVGRPRPCRRERNLPSRAGITADGPVELGIRPEHVVLGRLAPSPFTVERVEDIGRARIVRGRIAGQTAAAIVGEGAEIPAEAHASFAPGRLGVFKDSRRLEPA